MKNSLVFPLIALLLFGSGCASSLGPVSMSQPTPSGDASSTALVFGSPTTTPAEWKQILSPEAYDVIWNKGTEVPFSSPLDMETRPGTYVSADCGVPLFRSEQKYDSGTGWPSFWAPINPDVVKLVEDDSIPFEPRTEVVDAACGGHLGHVFDDGPQPTGKRFCMNGVALRFIPDAVTSTTPQK
ncbi:MAG: peptide-methionine (R)-S-oxide reductase MsrB [Patescibacteria group bacterium]